jgi:hypothetical protein
MNDSLTILSRHVAATLPDSLIHRRELLVAMRNLLKASHRAYKPISDQIAAIDAISQLQNELPLQFPLEGGTR